MKSLISQAIKYGAKNRGMRAARSALGKSVEPALRARTSVGPQGIMHGPTRPSQGLVLGSPNKLINPFNITSGIGGGGMGGSMLAGAGMGAMGGYMGSGEDNKMFGTVGGAFAGMVAGAGARSFARHGGSITNKAFGAFNKKAIKAPFISNGWKNQRGLVNKGLKGFHSAAARNTIFRSGAMLGGGAFGVMFASNGKSHKRGFNRNRGNSFSR